MVVAWSQKRVGGCGWSMVVVEDAGGVGEFSAKTVSAFCQSETKSAVMESRLGPIRLARREGEGEREREMEGEPQPPGREQPVPGLSYGGFNGNVRS